MKQSLLVLLFLFICVLSSFSQQKGWGTYELPKRDYSYLPKRLDWWIGASIGTTWSFADNAASGNIGKNIPSLDIQIGTFFTKSFGARVGGTMGPQTGKADAAVVEFDAEKYDTYYRFYTMHAYADAILDLTTLFGSKRRYRPTFDVMVFAGPGLIEAMHFDMKLKDWNEYPVDYQDKTCWVFHAGLMTAYRFSSHWDWTMEVSYNMTESRYDGVEESSSMSGFMKLHTGFTYHFYNRNDKQRVRLSTDMESDWAPRYTQEDRERVRKEQRERIEKARKESQKQRATKSEKIRKHNEEVKKANEQFRKDKEKRAKDREEARRYNESVY